MNDRWLLRKEENYLEDLENVYFKSMPLKNNARFHLFVRKTALSVIRPEKHARFWPREFGLGNI